MAELFFDPEWLEQIYGASAAPSVPAQSRREAPQPQWAPQASATPRSNTGNRRYSGQAPQRPLFFMTPDGPIISPPSGIMPAQAPAPAPATRRAPKPSPVYAVDPQYYHRRAARHPQYHEVVFPYQGIEYETEEEEQEEQEEVELEEEQDEESEEQLLREQLHQLQQQQQQQRYSRQVPPYHLLYPGIASLFGGQPSPAQQSQPPRRPAYTAAPPQREQPAPAQYPAATRPQSGKRTIPVRALEALLREQQQQQQQQEQQEQRPLHHKQAVPKQAAGLPSLNPSHKHIMVRPTLDVVSKGPTQAGTPPVTDIPAELLRRRNLAAMRRAMAGDVAPNPPAPATVNAPTKQAPAPTPAPAQRPGTRIPITTPSAPKPTRVATTTTTTPAPTPAPAPAPAATKPIVPSMSRSQAARTIQRWWRGWRVWGQRDIITTLVKQNTALKEASRKFYEYLIMSDGHITHKQYLEINELAMRVLLALDSCASPRPEIRTIRKRLTNKALSLQDQVALAYQASSKSLAAKRSASLAGAAAASTAVPASPAQSVLQTDTASCTDAPARLASTAALMGVALSQEAIQRATSGLPTSALLHAGTATTTSPADTTSSPADTTTSSPADTTSSPADISTVVSDSAVTSAVQTEAPPAAEADAAGAPGAEQLSVSTLDKVQRVPSSVGEQARPGSPFAALDVQGAAAAVQDDADADEQGAQASTTAATAGIDEAPQAKVDPVAAATAADLTVPAPTDAVELRDGAEAECYSQADAAAASGVAVQQQLEPGDDSKLVHERTAQESERLDDQVDSPCGAPTDPSTPLSASAAPVQFQDQEQEQAGEVHAVMSPPTGQHSPLHSYTSDEAMPAAGSVTSSTHSRKHRMRVGSAATNAALLRQLLRVARQHGLLQPTRGKGSNSAVSGPASQDVHDAHMWA